MLQILLPLATGFEEIEAVSIIDICRRADIKVIIAGVNEKTVLGAHNIPIIADCTINEVDVSILDMIVLPGGIAGTEILASDQTVQSILKKMKKDNKYIGAICAAPYALNVAGVLNKHYTCYPSTKNRIRTEGYSNNQHTIIDDKIMTSQGVGTAICFALEIVKILKGEAVYTNLKKGILAECNCC